ncbi:hypothetical protein SPLC1_S531330 [Arthrospira platensis C1]|nr:hypothetical protein SPLC1_S531330 [Arthrospira platensis C1]
MAWGWGGGRKASYPKGFPKFAAQTFMANLQIIGL